MKWNKKLNKFNLFMKKYFAVIKLLEKDLDEGNNGNIK